MLNATKFEIQFTDEADTHYNRLDTNMRRRVDAAIDTLMQNPLFGPNIKKLKGRYAGQYRYRVGSYRIIYSIDTQRYQCIVSGIHPRGRAYRR